MLKLNVEKVISAKAASKVVADESASKSAKMITLFLGGMDVKAIAILMDVRYNFVYNVVSNYARKEGLAGQMIQEKKTGVKDNVIALIEEGKTNVEISAILKANYNMVWKIRKEYEKGLDK